MRSRSGGEGRGVHAIAMVRLGEAGGPGDDWRRLRGAPGGRADSPMAGGRGGRREGKRRLGLVVGTESRIQTQTLADSAVPADRWEKGGTSVSDAGPEAIRVEMKRNIGCIPDRKEDCSARGET